MAGGRTWNDPLCGHKKGLKVGEVVELVVSHCDPTVNLFDEFYIVRAGRVIDIWPIDLRGKCQ